jgi:flagellar M-ring protein FliF
MNFWNIKWYFNQAVQHWNQLKPLQKIILGSLLVLAPILTMFLLLTGTSKNYVVLYSADQMQSTDIAKVKSHLDSMKVPYKVNENNLLLVPKEEEQQIRLELALYGLPKVSMDKGYELFDNTTWIKGEKELQILELRALKGQLEQDLSHFDNVRKASVIIDIPPARSFGGANYKTKASVILDLVPGARLSQQELRAITYHISGAVRGLTPSMVAISDTTGKLYQGLDYDGMQDSIRSSEIAAEDYIKAKIDGMLSTVLGFDNFYTTVQVSMNRDRITEERQVYSGSVEGVSLGQPVITSITKSNDQSAKLHNNALNSMSSRSPFSVDPLGAEQSEQLSVPMDHIKITSTPGKIRSISIGVLIDNKILQPEIFSYQGQFISSGYQMEDLKRHVESQISTLLKGYKVDYYEAVDFITFERTPKLPLAAEHPITITESNTNTLLFIIITITLIGILFMLFRFQVRPSYLPSLVERENYQKKAEKKSLTNLEEILDAIRARYQNNPNSILGTLRGWIQEDKS